MKLIKLSVEENRENFLISRSLIRIRIEKNDRIVEFSNIIRNKIIQETVRLKTTEFEKIN